MIIYQEFTSVSNYIPSNQYNGLKQQDLRQWMNEKEQNYQKDKERIQQICKKYNVKSREFISKRWIKVDRNHGIAVCTHDKVGSSTWSYHLRDLLPAEIFRQLPKQFNIKAGASLFTWSKAMDSYYTIPPNTVSGILSNMLSPYSINNFLTSNQILSFSFVRHPFERLVSAYKDKFSGNTKEFNRNYYPSHYSWWFKGGRSFSSFVDLVLYEYRTSCYPNNTHASRILTNWSNATCEDKVDTHWRPFTFKCSYCDINYDLIGRMETWNDDLNYIARKRGLEKVLIASNKNPSKLSTKEMTQEYFDTLSRKQKEDLYHMFRLDFEMFNYDPKMYL